LPAACSSSPFWCSRPAPEYPLIHLGVLVQPNVAVPALLISIYGFGATATSFVLPDYLTRVEGLRDLQIGDALNWIALCRNLCWSRLWCCY
jgi:MFS transporter, DHA2 family, multidrug resistance protein